VVFINGSQAGVNVGLRAHGHNCYAAGELNITAEIVDFSGASVKADAVREGRFVQADTRIVNLSITEKEELSYASAQQMTVQTPGDLEEALKYDPESPFNITNYRGRHEFHVRMRDRCGNELDTRAVHAGNGTGGDGLPLTSDEQEEILERNAFRIWVDRTPPPAAAGHVRYESKVAIPEKEALEGGVAYKVFATKAYYVVSTHDAVEAWQDQEDLEHWLFKAYRTPCALPAQSEYPIAAGEISPWLLREPVDLEGGTTHSASHFNPPIAQIRVKFRDSAGNFSAWHSVPAVTDPYFDNDGNPDNGPPSRADVPQFLAEAPAETDRDFSPRVVTVPPSFVRIDDPGHPVGQPFMVQHATGDCEPSGYVALGIAPVKFINTAFGCGTYYGYTDLLGVCGTADGRRMNGTIKGQATRTADDIFNSRWDSSGDDEPWDFRNADPGWARVVDYEIHSGYRWTNAVKMRPDIAATGSVMTLRINGGFIRPEQLAQFAQIVDVGGQKVCKPILPGQGDWYVKFYLPDETPHG